MDIGSYILAVCGLGNSISSALRLVVLAATITFGMNCAGSKRMFYCTFATLSIFVVLHVFFISFYTVPATADIVNLIRIFSLPLTAISLYAMLDADKTAIDALFRSVSAAFAVIAVVMLISTLTGTDPHTYSGKKLGTLGWFSNTNSQSAILSSSVPFAIAYTMTKKPSATPTVTFIGLAALYSIGTRLAYAAIFGISFAFLVAVTVMKRCGKSTASPIIFITASVIALILLPFSPMVENRRQVNENADIKAAVTDELYEFGGAEAVYSQLLDGLTERFGFDAVYDAYDASHNPSVLTDARLEKLTFSRLLLNERPLCRFFGLDYTSMTFDGESFDAENDFHGIFFLCGGFGLLMLILFLLSASLPLLFCVLRCPDKLTPQTSAALISFSCSLAHAYFTAGVLRRPNASFYLAATLAAMFYLYKNQKRRNLRVRTA